MKQVNSQETKQRILNAAVEEFVEYGYDGAHMQRIAEKSGTNKSIIYYYFKNKENLYEEVLSSIFEKSFDNVEMALNKKMSLNKTLTYLIENYINFLEQNPSLLRIMMWENASGGKHIKKLMKKRGSDSAFNVAEKLLRLLEDTIKRGELRHVDATQTIISVVGMCAFYFITKPSNQIIWQIDPDSEVEFIKQRKKIIVDLILYGLLPETEKSKNKVH